MNKKALTFKERKELIKEELKLQKEIHKYKMEEIELRFNRELEVQRIKSAEIRKTQERGLIIKMEISERR